jgi:hypothetical protein
VRGEPTPAPGEQHGSALTTIDSSLTAARPGSADGRGLSLVGPGEGGRRSCMSARQSGRFECSTEFDEQQKRRFGVLLLDGSRSEAKADRAAADFRMSSGASVWGDARRATPFHGEGAVRQIPSVCERATSLAGAHDGSGRSRPDLLLKWPSNQV